MSRVPLALAKRLAAEVVEVARPWCDQVEVAGSVRRGRPDVKDLDIVMQPALVFGEMLKPALAEAGATFIQLGEQSWVFDWKGIKVEVTLAVRECYPALLLWRTGSATHNIVLAQRARRKGLRMTKNGVLNAVTADVIAWESEEAIFNALGLDMVPPAEREV